MSVQPPEPTWPARKVKPWDSLLKAYIDHFAFNEPKQYEAYIAGLSTGYSEGVSQSPQEPTDPTLFELIGFYSGFLLAKNSQVKNPTWEVEGLSYRFSPDTTAARWLALQKNFDDANQAVDWTDVIRFHKDGRITDGEDNPIGGGGGNEFPLGLTVLTRLLADPEYHYEGGVLFTTDADAGTGTNDRWRVLMTGEGGTALTFQEWAPTSEGPYQWLARVVFEGEQVYRVSETGDRSLIGFDKAAQAVLFGDGLAYGASLDPSGLPAPDLGEPLSITGYYLGYALRTIQSVYAPNGPFDLPNGDPATNEVGLNMRRDGNTVTLIVNYNRDVLDPYTNRRQAIQSGFTPVASGVTARGYEGGRHIADPAVLTDDYAIITGDELRIFAQPGSQAVFTFTYITVDALYEPDGPIES